MSIAYHTNMLMYNLYAFSVTSSLLPVILKVLIRFTHQ